MTEEKAIKIIKVYVYEDYKKFIEDMESEA